ncbi:DUF262 domain-containing HNH endonuclease family protein [Acholeplasma vituli]|uniref:DUF262 domain-containing HNH endonuclease family protein n=1 Tax=Paracholeplasma vituli TaxID=69473 RepID=A0ABT2PXI1_9MOLU|nr:DUF262 domain-containing HNH endonuclease family protein [Paracholeplasma vituli]MCU0105671.1 DUF262 domain-containing HNH endonuclease family protein [Paracholeplasma vituli]
MKAEAQGFSYLKRDRRYDIPFFQRGYVWNQDNWEEFYDSIIESIRASKTAFLGSIIIKDSGRKEWDKSIYSIIDGQQRLTTISLFIKAFFDEKIQVGDTFYQEYLSTLFIHESRSSPNKQLKIHHSKLDKDEFEKCINSHYTDNYLTSNNTSKIFLCYKYFRERLKSLDAKSSSMIMELILDTESELYKTFVVIEIDSKENEQKIFDTVNSSGVKLTSADIIKNAIFEKMMSDSNKQQEVIDFYNETWAATFIKDSLTVKYWERETISGRIKRERIEVLLHSVAVIKQIYDPQLHKIEDLPDQYKEYISKKDYHNLLNLVKDICNFAKLYRDKFVDFDDDLGHAFSLEQREEVFHRILDSFDTSTFDPYILYLYYEHQHKKISDTELNTLLRKLEKYVARTLICGSDNKKNFNKNNSDLINPNSGTTLDSLLQRSDINDIEFKNSLKNIKNNQYGRILLYMIELNRLKNGQGMAGTSTIQFTFSLEHIMPQSYLTNWNLSVIPLDRRDQNGDLLSEELLNEYRQKAIYEIGNMTLLKQKLNSTISNESFEIKKKGKGKKPGINAYPQLSICTEITSEIDWNEDKIERRTNELASEILTFW